MTGLSVVLAQAADPDRVHRVTEAVLSRADYARSTGPSLLDRGLQALLEQLGRLLLRVDSDGGTGSVLAALALGATVLALAVALVTFLRRLRRSTTLDAVVEGPVGTPAASWAEQAEAAERDGDLREALRCRYRETLAHLAGSGLVQEVPGRTTREYLAATVRALPDAERPFEAMTGRFEGVWYGGQAVDGEGLATFRSAQTSVEAAIPRARLRGPT